MIMRRLATSLTREQKDQLSKASREAKEAFQPRRIAIGRDTFRLAECGEAGGTRYSVTKTTIEDLGHFGVAISGYFAHLYGLIIISFVMTAINMASMVYFESEQYRGDTPVPFALTGSAFCTSTESVTVSLRDGGSQTAIRNLCPFTSTLGYRSLASMVSMILFTMLFRAVVLRRLNKIDEAHQVG
jgi:hypothetical protein